METSPSPAALSALRKELRTRYEDMGPLLDRFLERFPMLKGCVYVSKGRCGQARCPCAKGALHPSTVLAYRGAGRQRNRHPSPEELPLLRRLTSAYQSFRQARAQWGKEARTVLEKIALLERARLQEGERQFRATEAGKSVVRRSR